MEFQENKFHYIAFGGLRAVVGAIFIVHGAAKFNPDFIEFVTGVIGFPAEMQIPIALAELVPGILLIIGVLTRISASLLSILMTWAIFYHLSQGHNFIGQPGWELALVLLAASLVIMVAGPGKVSIAHLTKKIPRLLQ